MSFFGTSYSKNQSRGALSFRWGLVILSFLSLVIFIVIKMSLNISGSPKTVVRFWNGFTGPDGRTMLQIVKRFNSSNPDVKVLMQRMDWATYYNKLFVAGLGARAPEVFIVHASYMERFMQAKFIRPVDDLVKGVNGIDIADITENVWKAVEKKGIHYGVPLDVHILGMYYNKTLLKQAGFVDEKGDIRPPIDKNEFMDLLEKIKKDSPDSNYWGYVFTWFRTNVYTIMCQYGGKFFNEDYTKCILNNPENIQALEFCADLIQTKKLVPSPENYDSWIGFRQGKVAVAFEGIYMLADLKKQSDLDYGAAPLPLIGTQPAAWADSHVMCIRGDLDGPKLEATWRFMKFLSDNSLDWAEGGQIPIRKSLINTDRFKQMTCQWEFSKQLPYIHYIPSVPFAFEFLTEFDIAIEKALRGSATAQQALDEATTNINKILERYYQNNRQTEGRN